MLNLEIEPEISVEDYASILADYRKYAHDDPVGYCKSMLGINLWSKQQEIIKALNDDDITYIAVKSGNGVGKTYLTAAMIINYLDTHCPGFAVVSGATWTGVLKTVWPTLRKVYQNSIVDLGGELLAAEWRRDNFWGAFCVSPDKPEGFSGFRTENGVLVIIDEASALDYKVYQAIRGLCSAKGSKIVLLGNPLYPEGPFFDAFSKTDDSWFTMSISSEEVAELDIPGLATKKWIEECKKEWGEYSPIYKARVLGEFPEGLLHNLVKLSWIEPAIIRKTNAVNGKIRMGVDVARYGEDRTVIICRDDDTIRYMEQHHGLSTTDVCGHVINAANKVKVNAEDIYIDDTGVGGGVTDQLQEQGHSVNGVNFGERANNSDKFVNKRAEMYFAIHDRLRPDSELKLYCPQEYKDILKECTWPMYKMTPQGKIQLEAKEDIKKRRSGNSPDLADALALTFAEDTCGIESLFI